MSSIRLSPRAADDLSTVTVRPPGSKSHSTRALVLAHLASGDVELENVSPSTDAVRLRTALAKLAPGGEATLDLHDGGAPARFALAAAAITPGRWTIDGTDRLRARPMGALLEALRALGAGIEGGPGLPVTVTGGAMRGGRARVDATRSSQFVSALLLAGAALPDGLALEGEGMVSRDYAALTVRMLRDFGASVEDDLAGEAWSVRVQGPLLPPERWRVPDDASGAVYAWLMGALGARPARATVTVRDPQPDMRFLDVLEAMGARVTRGDEDTVVAGPLLRGGTFDLRDFPDAAPAVAVAAATVEAPTDIVGVPHLADKESDRIGAVVEGLGLCGVTAEPRPDGLHVAGRPAGGLREATIPVRGDHRIAMAFACLGTQVPIVVTDPASTEKSFPGFFDAVGPFVRIESDDPGGQDV